jgi:hypothetical protein
MELSDGQRLDVSATTWGAYDEGYLRAYQWASSLAAGAPLPQETASLPLGPGEVAHAHLSPVSIVGFFGESGQYRRSFLLLGGPVGLALTGAASMARNAAKKAEAERAAIPRWHDLGTADLVMTNQRLAAGHGGQVESFWYAEAGPLAWAVGRGNAPAVQLQPSGMPPLRLESPWAPLLYVFVHHLLDGRPPGVPLPDGLLERATAQGRVST